MKKNIKKYKTKLHIYDSDESEKSFYQRLLDTRFELLGNKYPMLRQIMDDKIDLVFYFTKVNYDEAVNICQSQAMDVFFPRTFGEAKFVAEMRDHVYGKTNDWAMAGFREYDLPFWVGARRRPNSGSDFVTRGGYVRDFYNHLMIGDPSFTGIQWGRGSGNWGPDDD